MSTTVTYKGETLATVNNNTKVLETEGKYLEDDITLVDVTGGGSATLGEKSINANGVYNASSDNLDGYSKVTVSVPNSYSAGDEGKVVSSGALVSQSSSSTSSNGTVDTTLINSLSVSVPTGTARSSSDLTASNLTVTAPAGLYASAASKTLSDQNLVAGNIKKDVEIFGVTGSYEGSGGGGNVSRVTGTVTGNGTRTISITCDKPDMYVIYRSDISNMQAVSDRANAANMMRMGIISGSLYTTAGTTTIGNSGTVMPQSVGESSTPGNNQAGYTNGALYVTSGNNSNLFSTSLTYNYELYYFT